MEEKHLHTIAREYNIGKYQVEAVAGLLKEGGTIPFIARYRKEATGSFDEVAVTAIRDRLNQLEELDKRRESILKSLTERELLTDELRKKILNSETMTALEDIYLPYRPKRRTRASIAREKGHRWTKSDDPGAVRVIRQIDQEAMKRDIFNTMKGKPTRLIGAAASSRAAASLKVLSTRSKLSRRARGSRCARCAEVLLARARLRRSTSSSESST